MSHWLKIMTIPHPIRVLALVLAASNVKAEVRCRYNATAPDPVSYYTCTELAERHEITLEHFFALNPLVDSDCSSIEAGERYCVAGTAAPTTTDGSCSPDSYVTCLGYSGGQCCNLETFRCGDTEYVPSP